MSNSSQPSKPLATCSFTSHNCFGIQMPATSFTRHHLVMCSLALHCCIHSNSMCTAALHVCKISAVHLYVWSLLPLQGTYYSEEKGSGAFHCSGNGLSSGYPGLPTVALNGPDMTDSSCGKCIVLQGSGMNSLFVCRIPCSTCPFCCVLHL